VVRPSHMRAWIKDRSEVLAPSTLAVVWANVASMFSAAVPDRVKAVSPCTGVKLPNAAEHGRFIPTGERVRAVAEGLPERYRAIAWLAAGCGWRRSEILGAEVGAIDFLRRTAEVRQQLLAGTGEPLCLARSKTPTSYRVSKLPEVTSMALARHLEKHPAAERPIRDTTDPRKPVDRPAALLFTTQSGRPVHPAWWNQLWRKAGIPAGVGIHCLRHYYATVLIHEGADVKTVQLAMGHKTPMITLNTYAGEWPESGGRTQSIIDAALGSVPADCHDLEAQS
jgi:integrase